MSPKTISEEKKFFVAITFRNEDKATFIKQNYFCRQICFATILNFWRQKNYVANNHFSCSAKMCLIDSLYENQAIIGLPKRYKD